MSRTKAKPVVHTQSVPEPQYTLTLTRTQVGVIQMACEFLSRIGMGQIHVLVDHLPNTYEATNEEKEMLRDMERKAIVSPGNFSRIAWDLYQVTRHRLSWDYCRDNGITPSPGALFHKPPMRTIDHPLATIKEVTSSISDAIQ